MLTMLGGSCLKTSRSASLLILRRKAILAVSAETDDMEDFLANVDADRGERCGGHGLLLRMLQGSLCRLSPRGKQPVHPITGGQLCATRRLMCLIRPSTA